MENYLYPFFWQHGEDHDVLKKYMEKISGCGMKGVCVEARPHPDFVGDGWWKDMDFILDKAKKLDMKLWILDDSHFPTGYANGRIKSDYPQYLKKYLDMRRYDVQGPLRRARIDFSLLKGRPWDKPDPEQEILKVLLAKRISQRTEKRDPVIAESICDITEQMNRESRLLTLDVPEGAWSIFVVYLTKKGGEQATQDYLNPLVREATEVLIREVYEPHYAHYKKNLEKPFRAFSLMSHVLEISREQKAVWELTWYFHGGMDWKKNLALKKNICRFSGQMQKVWKKIFVSSIWILSQDFTMRILPRFLETGAELTMCGIWVIPLKITEHMPGWDMEPVIITGDSRAWILRESM